MPCPYFEPQQSVAGSGIRLPLIEEYSGYCRAATPAFPVPEELRLRCCNHGNCASACTYFPAGAPRSSQRFDLVGSNSAVLEVLFVEERHYAPAAWQRVKYSIGSELLDPEISDVCARAQLIAFCRSFLKHFHS